MARIAALSTLGQSHLPELAAALGTTVARAFSPRDGYILVDGLRLHYLEWGQPEHSPVVLLHSGEETARSWDLLGQALADDYHVLALDSRGCGLSERAPDGRYTQEGYVRDVRGLLRALDLRDAVLIGQAYGARHALITAAAEAQRTRGLVIVDTAPEVDPEATRQVHELLRSTMRVESYEAFVRIVGEFNPLRPYRQLHEMLRHELRQRPDGSWTWNRDMRTVLDSGSDSSGMQTPEFLWSSLRALSCPTLVIRGALSAFVPEEMAVRMCDAIPDARLETIADAGHLVAGDNPAVFERVIRRFLSELASLG